MPRCAAMRPLQPLQGIDLQTRPFCQTSVVRKRLVAVARQFNDRPAERKTNALQAVFALPSLPGAAAQITRGLSNTGWSRRAHRRLRPRDRRHNSSGRIDSTADAFFHSVSALRQRQRSSRRHQILLEQLRQFPLGKHDDGPDALEMAIQMARYNPARVIYCPE